MSACNLAGQHGAARNGVSQCENLSVATPAEPRGKFPFFVQILGGEKLLKLVEEKCR